MWTMGTPGSLIFVGLVAVMVAAALLLAGSRRLQPNGGER